MVLEYVPGGELFTHLKRCRKLKESDAAFYAAQIVTIFEYLHHLGIIYRDLKPENLLIHHNGYLKMTDFGFAKHVGIVCFFFKELVSHPMIQGRTWTLCGTPDYLAPELILSKGYSFSIDWWALGILIFEMIMGHPPFFSSEPVKGVVNPF